MERNFISEILIKWYGSVEVRFEGGAVIQVENSNKLLESETDFQKRSESYSLGRHLDEN